MSHINSRRSFSPPSTPMSSSPSPYMSPFPSRPPLISIDVEIAPPKPIASRSASRMDWRRSGLECCSTQPLLQQASYLVAQLISTNVYEYKRVEREGTREREKNVYIKKNIISIHPLVIMSLTCPMSVQARPVVFGKQIG